MNGVGSGFREVLHPCEEELLVAKALVLLESRQDLAAALNGGQLPARRHVRPELQALVKVAGLELGLNAVLAACSIRKAIHV